MGLSQVSDELFIAVLWTLSFVGVWNETEGGSDAAIHAAYGLEYSWAAADDGTLEVTVASTSEEAEGESMRRKTVRGGGTDRQRAVTDPRQRHNRGRGQGGGPSHGPATASSCLGWTTGEGTASTGRGLPRKPKPTLLDRLP
jgi:hypothetical protein